MESLTNSVDTICANASSLVERMEQFSSSADHGDDSSNDADMTRRLQYWKERAADGNEELFLRRLKWDGLDIEQAKTLLAFTPQPRPDARPRWGQIILDLLSFLESVPASGDKSSDEQQAPFCALWEPIVNFAVSQLNVKISTPSANIAPALEAFRQQLLILLAGQGATALYQDFSIRRSLEQAQLGVNKPHFYTRYVSGMLDGGLLKFFEEYPVLARIIGTAIEHWCDTVAEFIQRLEADLAELKITFPDIVDGYPIAFDTGLSDSHRGGRTVICMTFGNGEKLIYKPKNLIAEQYFQNLLQWLEANDLMGSTPLKTSKVLVKEDHGWVEYIPHLACQDEGEVQRYYERAGKLLFLLYLIGASDVHMENLICCGENPVLIDMETLLHHVPMFEGEREFNASDIAMREFYFDSVVRPAMLPRWEYGANSEAYDVSGLGGVYPYETSIKNVIWKNMNSDHMSLTQTPHMMQAGKNAVRLNGDLIDPTDHVQDLINGFQDLFRQMMAAGQKFLASGPLGNMIDVHNRYIFRNTRVYYILMNQLLSPQHLKSGLDAGIHIDVFSRALVIQEQECPPIWPIIQSEHKAIFNLDVPMIMAPASGSDIFLDDGSKLSDIFEGASFDLIETRVQALSEQEMERQTQYIRACFIGMNGPEENASTPQVQSGFNTKSDCGSALSKQQSTPVQCASHIADEIINTAIRSKDGSASWMSVSYEDVAQRWQFQPMRMRMYDGILGTTLFLAAAYRATGNDDYKETALAAIAPLVDNASDVSLHRALFSSGIGAGTGGSSVIYSLVRMADLLGRTDLLDVAKTLSSSISPEMIEKDTRLDVMGGAAGLIMGLAPLYEKKKDSRILEMMRLSAKTLLSKQETAPFRGKAWQVLGGQFISGLSHGAAGISLALSRLHKLDPDPALLKSIHEALEFENGAFEEGDGDWPDFRYPKINGKYTYHCSWCNGAPGIALARMGMMEAIDDFDVEADINNALNITATAPLNGIDHVCCGSFGREEALRSSCRHSSYEGEKGNSLQRHEPSFLSEPCKDNYALGWSHGPYIPSFFQGTAGIGYQFLRQQEPDTFPSILMFS